MLEDAKHQSHSDFHMHIGMIKIVKAMLLTIKQTELFIPSCYLEQAEDYWATPTPQRDGVTISMVKDEP